MTLLCLGLLGLLRLLGLLGLLGLRNEAFHNESFHDAVPLSSGGYVSTGQPFIP